MSKTQFIELRRYTRRIGQWYPARMAATSGAAAIVAVWGIMILLVCSILVPSARPARQYYLQPVTLDQPARISPIAAPGTSSTSPATVPLAVVPGLTSSPAATSGSANPPAASFRSAGSLATASGSRLAAPLAATSGLATPTTVAYRLADSPAATLRSAEPGDESDSSTWRSPLASKPEVIRGFEKPAQNWLKGHRGADLAAEAGQAVLSPANGKVSFSGWIVDRPVLSVEHANGLRSTFEPAESSLRAGTPVSAGEQIGQVSSEIKHCPDRFCLHWGLKRGDDYLNPLSKLEKPQASVLLPLLPWPDGERSGVGIRPPDADDQSRDT